MTSRVSGYGRGAAAIELAPVPEKNTTVPTSPTAFDFGQLIFYPSGPTWYIYSGGSTFYPFAGVGTILGTANQIVVTNSGGVDTLSLASTLIAPGSVEVTTTFTVDGVTSAISNGNTASTITIGNGTGGNAISICCGANTASQAINIANGAAGANSTVNFFGTASTAGTQTFNVFGSGATRAGAVNICTGAAPHVCTIGSLTGAAQLVLQSGTGGISLSSGATNPGTISMAPALISGSTTPLTVNARLGQATFTGFTTAAGAIEVIVVDTNLITATTQSVFVSVDNLGTNDAQMSVQRVLLAVGAITLTLKNNGAAALNGNLHVNFWVIN